MKTWAKNELFEIHLELSSNCQASCPACSRTYDYNERILKGKSPNAWDVDSLHRVFNKEALLNIKEFLLCGNYGDPMAFPEISRWIGDVLQINPTISFWIHTNGGLGSQQTWKELGTLLRKSSSNIHFSLDGLADTNHIYRRGVDWELVLRNAKTFIDAGGPATWKFIEFSHNSHQIEQARAMANEMGFKKFKVIAPYSDEGDISKIPKASELDPDLQVSFEHNTDEELQRKNFSALNHIQNPEIGCEAIAENSIYVDCDKKLWPCCWMARTSDHRLRLAQREEFYRKVYSQYGLNEGFNSLLNQPLFDALEHRFFKQFLPNSWSKESLEKKACLSICLEKCSKGQTTQE
jgi:sulfatase maturation enzyme AslB (radical SAM superfamily)